MERDSCAKAKKPEDAIRWEERFSEAEESGRRRAFCQAMETWLWACLQAEPGFAAEGGEGAPTAEAPRGAGLPQAPATGGRQA